MRLALFALTGFGNIVLKSFLNQGVKPLVLITRKEKNKFPYYKLENISSLARRNKIKVEYDKTFIKNKNVDLLVVATYHKKINLSKINVKLAVNFHPSLLPEYPGKDPILDLIKDNKRNSGVSIHKLTKIFDKGKIIYKKKIIIKKKLNKKNIMLSKKPLFEKCTKFIINHFKKNF